MVEEASRSRRRKREREKKIAYKIFHGGKFGCDLVHEMASSLEMVYRVTMTP